MAILLATQPYGVHNEFGGLPIPAALLLFYWLYQPRQRGCSVGKEGSKAPLYWLMSTGRMAPGGTRP